MKNNDDRLLTLIGIFKLFKTFTLVAAGIGALHLRNNNDAATLITHLAEKIGLNPGSHYLDLALAKVANIPQKDFVDLGIGSFVYAALFLTEGVGLLLAKPWAEWFTTIITSSLVPIEVLEIVHHPSIAKVILLLLNILIVGYLIVRIRNKRHLR